jgi:hypothetical protein
MSGLLPGRRTDLLAAFATRTADTGDVERGLGAKAKPPSDARPSRMQTELFAFSGPAVSDHVIRCVISGHRSFDGMAHRYCAI